MRSKHLCVFSQQQNLGQGLYWLNIFQPLVVMAAVRSKVVILVLLIQCLLLLPIYSN